MDASFGDMEERRNGRLDVIQSVYFDAALSLILTIEGPLESLKTKLYSR